MTPTRNRLAIHESGHATAALALGIRVESVTIVGDSASYGHASFGHAADFRDRLIVDCAGSVAEAKQFGGDALSLFRDSGHCAEDRDHFDRLGVRSGCSYSAAIDRARTVLGRHWAACRRLAEALLQFRTIRGEFAREIFNHFQQRGSI